MARAYITFESAEELERSNAEHPEDTPVFIDWTTNTIVVLRRIPELDY